MSNIPPFLPEDEMQALRRFDETASDDGSTDLPATMLGQLVRRGALRRDRAEGVWTTTDYGWWLISSAQLAPVAAAAGDLSDSDAQELADWRSMALAFETHAIGGPQLWPNNWTQTVSAHAFALDGMLSRREAAGAVPEGWKMAPKVATGKMLAEARNHGRGLEECWAIMLASAPSPPAAPAALSDADADRIAAAAENAVGMGAEAWDDVPPRALVRAILSAAGVRAAPAVAVDEAKRARHIKVLKAIGSTFKRIPAPCEERDAINAAIAALQPQQAGETDGENGGDA